ncbi:uncharacterized protein AMSG_11082 [Thecamonas trahens ATCC 50062]|uniref:TLC domain-containing protein n=1 Tax=Thecamonas trahens ATCC 50062 TaxID=461836 RepID=A0A0L0DT21_THETB|nr:hypothetical protein AMSG_11082 [Thecamonas trahens ATCC 50062]KNC55420.1 hypothetical protein AMSG_11082 [Thecamonas trahens ATCC 50062]|eukprot:XP_013752959.1 hypothetical protein AMSG_11082 [Thecamonas trahens ATCC 50062]
MLADLLYHMVFIPMLVIQCVIGLGWERSSWEEAVKARWHARSHASDAYLILYLSSTIVHAGVVAMKDLPQTAKLQLAVHHLISIASYGMALASGKAHPLCLAAGLCEINAYFLNIVLLCKELGVNSGLFLTFTGILLWVTQIALRLVLFSVLSYGVAVDIISGTPELDGVPAVQACSDYPWADQGSTR